MSEIGYGYGIAWHLLRYLGYHRGSLDAAVKAVMPEVREIEWLDFRFAPNRKFLDAELRGVEFLMDDEPAKVAWPRFWPATGTPPTWDAVGLLTLDTNDLMWMLVEAKAHVGELASSCAAAGSESRSQIREALHAAKNAYGVAEDRDWTSGYYQYANRLAVLHHFSLNRPGARLLNIYFTGDRNRNADCPASVDEWLPHLKARNEYMGLGGGSALEKLVYDVFLPVCGMNGGYGGARA